MTHFHGRLPSGTSLFLSATRAQVVANSSTEPLNSLSVCTPPPPSLILGQLPAALPPACRCGGRMRVALAAQEGGRERRGVPEWKRYTGHERGESFSGDGQKQMNVSSRIRQTSKQKFIQTTSLAIMIPTTDNNERVKQHSRSSSTQSTGEKPQRSTVMVAEQ